MAYWRSKDHFAASVDRLARVLGASDAIVKGYVTEVVQPRVRVWKRPVFWYGLLLHIAAVVGALKAVDQGRHWLLASPEVSIGLRDGASMDSLSSAEFVTALEAVNHAPQGATEFTINGIVVTPLGQETAISNDFVWFPDAAVLVEPGEQSLIRIEGTGPPPGEYEMKIGYSIKGGRLRSWVSSERAFMFRSWPTVHFEPPRVHSVENDICWVRSALLLGTAPAKALEGEVMVLRRPDVELIGVQFPGTTQWWKSENKSVPDREVTSIRWPVGQPSAFSEIEFDVLLKGSLDTDWERVVREMELSFYEQN